MSHSSTFDLLHSLKPSASGGFVKPPPPPMPPPPPPLPPTQSSVFGVLRAQGSRTAFSVTDTNNTSNKEGLVSGGGFKLLKKQNDGGNTMRAGDDNEADEHMHHVCGGMYGNPVEDLCDQNRTRVGSYSPSARTTSSSRSPSPQQVQARDKMRPHTAKGNNDIILGNGRPSPSPPTSFFAQGGGARRPLLRRRASGGRPFGVPSTDLSAFDSDDSFEDDDGGFSESYRRHALPASITNRRSQREEKAKDEEKLKRGLLSRKRRSIAQALKDLQRTKDEEETHEANPLAKERALMQAVLLLSQISSRRQKLKSLHDFLVSDQSNDKWNGDWGQGNKKSGTLSSKLNQSIRKLLMREPESLDAMFSVPEFTGSFNRGKKHKNVTKKSKEKEVKEKKNNSRVSSEEASLDEGGGGERLSSTSSVVSDIPEPKPSTGAEGPRGFGANKAGGFRFQPTKKPPAKKASAGAKEKDAAESMINGDVNKPMPTREKAHSDGQSKIDMAAHPHSDNDDNARQSVSVHNNNNNNNQSANLTFTSDLVSPDTCTFGGEGAMPLGGAQEKTHEPSSLFCGEFEGVEEDDRLASSSEDDEADGGGGMEEARYGDITEFELGVIRREAIAQKRRAQRQRQKENRQKRVAAAAATAAASAAQTVVEGSGDEQHARIPQGDESDMLKDRNGNPLQGRARFLALQRLRRKQQIEEEEEAYRRRMERKRMREELHFENPEEEQAYLAERDARRQRRDEERDAFMLDLHANGEITDEELRQYQLLQYERAQLREMNANLASQQELVVAHLAQVHQILVATAASGAAVTSVAGIAQQQQLQEYFVQLQQQQVLLLLQQQELHALRVARRAGTIVNISGLSSGEGVKVGQLSDERFAAVGIKNVVPDAQTPQQPAEQLLELQRRYNHSQRGHMIATSLQQEAMRAELLQNLIAMEKEDNSEPGSVGGSEARNTCGEYYDGNGNEGEGCINEGEQFPIGRRHEAHRVNALVHHGGGEQEDAEPIVTKTIISSGKPLTAATVSQFSGAQPPPPAFPPPHTVRGDHHHPPQQQPSAPLLARKTLASLGAACKQNSFFD